MTELQGLLVKGRVMCLRLQIADSHVQLGFDVNILILLGQWPHKGGVVRAYECNIRV